MKRLILMACIAGMMAPVGLYAQKVYKDGDKVILDMTVEAGMPAEAITDDSKTYWYNSVEPKNNAMTIINEANNNLSHPLNAKVYHKLEIYTSEPTYISWADAFNYCKLRGDWRPPTQRELYMMYIFKPALNDLLVTDFSSKPYWTSVESYASYYAQTVRFSDGNVSEFNKTADISVTVRCVREVTQ